MQEGDDALFALNEAARNLHAFEECDDPDAWCARPVTQMSGSRGSASITSVLQGALSGSVARPSPANTCWGTLIDESIAVRHRWHCRCCAAKCRTTYGVLLKIGKGGIAHDCSAELLPPHFFDAKGMMVPRLTLAP